MSVCMRDSGSGGRGSGGRIRYSVVHALTDLLEAHRIVGIDGFLDDYGYQHGQLVFSDAK